VISSITAAFACVGMGLLSSVGRPPAGALWDQRPRRRGTPRRRAHGARDGRRAPVDRTVLLRGSPGFRDLRSHADVRRPAVLGGTAARVRDGSAGAVIPAPLAEITRSRHYAGPDVPRSRDLGTTQPLMCRDHAISARRDAGTHEGPTATSAAGPPELLERPRPGSRPEPAKGGEDRVLSQAVGSSTSMLRVRFGSTGIPGPMVVETVTFFRYRPLAEDGLARRTSSRAAA